MKPIEPTPKHDVLDREDASYVRTNYFTLPEVCLCREESEETIRECMGNGALPCPSYLLEGLEMVPCDYFLLVDTAGCIGAIKDHFLDRYLRIAKRHPRESAEEDAQSAWNGYLTGGFGVCLRSVTPENIFLKEQCMEKIESLMADPNAGDSSWRNELVIFVRRLDFLERPFAKVDRARFGGSVSRDRLIAEPRKKYPELFRGSSRLRE